MLLKLISLKRALSALIIFSLSGFALWHLLLRFSDRWVGQKTRTSDSPWTYTCEQQMCVKQLRAPSADHVPLVTCQMLCGGVPLWPYPTGTVRVGNYTSAFRLGQLAVKVRDVGPAASQALLQAVALFRGNLRRLIPADASYRHPSDVNEVEVSLKLTGSVDDTLRLTLATNESYRLVVSRVSRRLSVRVYGASYFGARHGLETLSQLVWWDGDSLRILHDALIVDAPRFPYRALMVDTARNFMPVPSLKVTLDAMAASKLNAFHWHMSDSQSFPFDSPRVPNMSRYGAYSPQQVYSAVDVKELTAYALVRGVRIIPEIDAPAHAGNGWQWGSDAGLGKLSLCINQQPWQNYCGQPPCGQLNPDNKHSYRVLGDLYRDLVELTSTTDMFHLGGDEVNMDCWRQELPPKSDFPKQTNFLEKWKSFEVRALEQLKAANGGALPDAVVVWSSQLTEAGMLNKDDYVVQVWGGSTWGTTNELLDAGYRIIISHVDAWYLDCGLGDYRKMGEGPCGPLATWQAVYQHRPWDGLEPRERALVLGGEACLWTERSDEQVLDSRLWPRGAALAERLWSDPNRDLPTGQELLPEGTNDNNLLRAYQRLSLHRERLVGRGVRADAMQPGWCQQNPFMCF